MQALSSKLAELQAAIAAIGQGGQGVSQQALDAVNQKIAEVGAAAAAAVETAKAGEGRLAALEQSVAGLSDQVAKQAAQPKVALAIAAAALKSAIERGGPFMAEVETFAAIAPESPELPALRDIAAKGVASRADLVAEVDDAANAMIAASESVGEDAGFWERLLSSAESLIKVRPIGAIEGDTRAGQGGAHGSGIEGRRACPGGRRIRNAARNAEGGGTTVRRQDPRPARGRTTRRQGARRRVEIGVRASQRR